MDNAMSEQELIDQCTTDFRDDVVTQLIHSCAFGVLEACEVYYLNGCYDDVSGDVEAPTGHFYRIHRWIVTTDSQGFNELFTFDTEDEAIQAFKKLDDEYSEWGDEDVWPVRASCT